MALVTDIKQLATAIGAGTGHEVGKSLHEIVLAFFFIIDALRRQPGFDDALFAANIREALKKCPEDHSLTRLLLEDLLEPALGAGPSA
jgi:hypothetical protein